MNKKIITALIVLMGFSILGIIAVQMVWMSNAIRVKSEQFDRGVSDALNQTVDRLEIIHDVMMINVLAFPDSGHQIERHMLVPAPPRFKSGTNGHPTRRIREIRPVRKSERAEIEFKWESRSDSGANFQMASSRLPKRTDTIEGGNREIVIVRSGSMQHVNSVINRGIVSLDSLTVSLDTSGSRTSAFEKKIHVRASSLKNLAERAASEIAVLDTPRINQQELEQVLIEELDNRLIPISFQYGVFRDTSLLYSSDSPDTLALSESSLQANLFPNNVFRQDVRLSLYFPGRDKFIYRSISWLLGASFLFSVIILVAFALSIFFLLKQKKISEMKADFINNMTHEFKTPIATISVAADSIMSERVIGDRNKLEYFTGMIKKENQRMNRQVEDILTIARLEKKEFDFRWEELDLHEVISEVCDVIRVQVEQREGKILVVQEAMDSIVKADRQHLSHVIFNLLDNANKYSPEAPDITIRTRNSGHQISVAVSDHGTGMTRQVQSRIFERFYRQSTGNIHNVKGFGLGLSYAKAVVTAHKGDIKVVSEPGRGSTFTVTLPVIPATHKI